MNDDSSYLLGLAARVGTNPDDAKRLTQVADEIEQLRDMNFRLQAALRGAFERLRPK